MTIVLEAQQKVPLFPMISHVALPKFYTLSRLVVSPHSLTHAFGGWPTILFACDPGGESRDSIFVSLD